MKEKWLDERADSSRQAKPPRTFAASRRTALAVFSTAYCLLITAY